MFVLWEQESDLLMESEEHKKHDLDLGRHRNHRRVFPWVFIIKVVIGLGMIAFIYYFSNQLIEDAETKKENEMSIPVEVEN